MTSTYPSDPVPENASALGKKFDFLQSHSIAANFGHLIAQTEQKSTQKKKSKKKRRKLSNHEDSSQYINGRTTAPGQPYGKMDRSLTPEVAGRDASETGNRFQSPFETSTPMIDGPSELNAGFQASNINSAPRPFDTSSTDMEMSSGSEMEMFSSESQMKTVVDCSEHGKLDQQPQVLENAENPIPDCMDVDSGSIQHQHVKDEAIDESSVSHRTSLTPFDGSATSSRTSALTSNDPHYTKLDSFPPPLQPSLTEAVEPPINVESEIAVSTRVPKPRGRPRGTPNGASRANRTGSKTTKVEATPERRHSRQFQTSVIAQQSIHAAFASRLSPFALHPQEYTMLRDHICHVHVTTYLNIRNRILRLWVRSPLVQVTVEEAKGCAHSPRFFGLAEFAYEWLIRKGYINFGCLEISNDADKKHNRTKGKRSKRKKIIVIGAGMSGLGCARQLEGLTKQFEERWSSSGEEPPQIILLEGRNRIGGRVYSHHLKDQCLNGIPTEKRATVELGGHIVIGFDHGNPMNVLVRGQLGLHYHTLRDNLVLYDVDGSVVDSKRDRMVEALYNDCLDRASAYRHRTVLPQTASGSRDLIATGQDPHQKAGPTIAEMEAQPPKPLEESRQMPSGQPSASLGPEHLQHQSASDARKKEGPAIAAAAMGWHLGKHVLSYDDLNLDAVATSSANPSLGSVMDEAVKQFQFLLDLTPQDMRLINWHYANLEYANAANVSKLSLSGWDQDAGNEFEGRHTQIIGGYQQVPLAILQRPEKLDLRTRKAVSKIEYNIWSGNSKSAGAKVYCEDGQAIEADHVILTTPLGVLKDQTIAFSPPLPDWKLGPIKRLGFGILNKCILIYDAPFWNVDQDMFGLLREPEVQNTLDQEDYVTTRGRFYFFWNCIKTSGKPVLISLLAGDAAMQTESNTDAALIGEVTRELRKMFPQRDVPLPTESVITRWRADRFARGTYSFVGADAQPGDYDRMAAPVGNLHFAGEATCATHPATVHGAYISGLRAASEVIDDLLGPIEVRKPLVLQPTLSRNVNDTEQSSARLSSDVSPRVPPTNSFPGRPDPDRVARLESFEADIIRTIHLELGFRPSPPKNTRSNAFLIYSSEQWNLVKDSVSASATPQKSELSEIRTRLGNMWTALPEAEKQPYKDKATAARSNIRLETLTFDSRLREWDNSAMALRRKYVSEHPGVLTEDEEKAMWANLEQYGPSAPSKIGRKAKLASGYADQLL